MERVICLIIGYAFGLLQTGVLVGKTKHIDIREQGSGNAGATNALRVLGIKAGAITFLGDCFKCVLAILLVGLIFGEKHTDMMPLLKLYAGFGCTLGHNFPFYLNFKGGKGIAVLAGMILSTSWWMTLICLVAFLGVVIITKYISVGSLLVSLLFAVMIIGNAHYGGFAYDGTVMASQYVMEISVLAAAIMALAWFRHRANIKRLLSGTENKLSIGKSK